MLRSITNRDYFFEVCKASFLSLSENVFWYFYFTSPFRTFNLPAFPHVQNLPAPSADDQTRFEFMPFGNFAKKPFKVSNRSYDVRVPGVVLVGHPSAGEFRSGPRAQIGIGYRE